MPRVVLDASSLVGALLKSASLPSEALFIARWFWVICLSDDVEAEIREVFARPRFAPYLAFGRGDIVLSTITVAATRFQPAVTIHDCRDGKDNKYLELALAAAAHTIVSSDNDLLTLHPWRGVNILSPAQFVADHKARIAVPPD